MELDGSLVGEWSTLSTNLAPFATFFGIAMIVPCLLCWRRISNAISVAFVVVLSFSVDCFGQEISSIELSVSSADKVTILNGVATSIKSVSKKSARYALLIGGSLTERDGVGEIDGVLIPTYKFLADELTRRGFVVARFDQRGVRAGLSCLNDQVGEKKSLARCIDSRIRQTYSSATPREDILTQYEKLKSTFGAKDRDITVIAHSEGGYHVARMIFDKMLNPGKVVFLATPFEAIGESTEWRFIGANIQRIATCDTEGDAFVTNEELRSCYQKTIAPHFSPLEFLISPSGGWSIKDTANIAALLRTVYLAQIESVTKAQPNDGLKVRFGDIEVIATTMGQYSELLNERRDFAKLLSNFRGQIMFSWAGKDQTFSATRQLSFSREFRKQTHVSCVLLSGANHNLVDESAVADQKTIPIRALAQAIELFAYDAKKGKSVPRTKRLQCED